jgi:hypothetical protein
VKTGGQCDEQDQPLEVGEDSLPFRAQAYKDVYLRLPGTDAFKGLRVSPIPAAFKERSRGRLPLYEAPSRVDASVTPGRQTFRREVRICGEHPSEQGGKLLGGRKRAARLENSWRTPVRDSTFAGE